MTPSTSSRAITLLFATMCMLAALPGANAQRAAAGSDDSVPRALAEALLYQPETMLPMGRASSRPRVLIGELPEGLAERLWLPPGATVLGGMESNDMGIAVIRSTLPADSLAAAYRREQVRLGWATPMRDRFQGIAGFAPAPGSADDPASALLFCMGGTVLSIGIERTMDAQEIRAQAASIGASFCDPTPPNVPRPPFDPWANRPTLTNPPFTGDGRESRCSDYNFSGGGGGTALITTMSLDQILTHYGRQLADSGWTALPEGEEMSRTWTRRDDSGTLMELTLTARRRAATARCVEMEMEMRGRR